MRKWNENFGNFKKIKIENTKTDILKNLLVERDFY